MYYLYLPAKQKHQFSLFMTLSIRSLLGALTTFSSQLACNVLCHNVHPGIEINGYSHTYIMSLFQKEHFIENDIAWQIQDAIGFHFDINLYIPEYPGEKVLFLFGQAVIWTGFLLLKRNKQQQ